MTNVLFFPKKKKKKVLHLFRLAKGKTEEILF